MQVGGRMHAAEPVCTPPYLQNLADEVTSATAHMAPNLPPILEEQECWHLYYVVLLQQLLRLLALITHQPGEKGSTAQAADMAVSDCMYWTDCKINFWQRVP